MLRLAILEDAPHAFSLDLSEAQARDESAWKDNIPQAPAALFGLFNRDDLAGSAAFRRESAIKQLH